MRTCMLTSTCSVHAYHCHHLCDIRYRFRERFGEPLWHTHTHSFSLSFSNSFFRWSARDDKRQPTDTWRALSRGKIAARWRMAHGRLQDDVANRLPFSLILFPVICDSRQNQVYSQKYHKYHKNIINNLFLNLLNACIGNTKIEIYNTSQLYNVPDKQFFI